MKKVVVIGAGASGLMAAYAAAERGNSVTVLERNEKAGKKIYITGKGRCNVTNAVPPDIFLENVVHNAKFLRGCIYSFPPERLMRFFEEHGLRLKVERGNRVFPASDHASDVTKCLEKACIGAGVRFQYNGKVSEIQKTGEEFCVRFDGGVLNADAVILCTGGVSYPGTGSTGDGYVFAEKFALNLIPRKPALCGIECEMDSLRMLQGLSLKNVRISAYCGQKTVGSFFGELLFTHFGVSGPIVLSLSSLLNAQPIKNVKLNIDLKPAMGAEILDKRILRDFEPAKNKQIQNALGRLLPKSLILPVLHFAHILPDAPVNSITREQRAALVRAVKAFPLTPLSLRPIGEAIVTSGGVDVKEVDPKTMESKKVSGLYICGELLDVDAFTGGFNLHIAFATGYAAGSAIA